MEDRAQFRKLNLNTKDRRFLENAEMTPEMKENLAGNIAYWSTLLIVPNFRDLFVRLVKDVEQSRMDTWWMV